MLYNFYSLSLSIIKPRNMIQSIFSLRNIYLYLYL